MLKFIKKYGEFTESYKFEGTNSLGESLEIDITLCTDPGGKKSLPALWHKARYTSKRLLTWWSVTTYVTSPDGCCRRDYNPQTVVKEKMHNNRIIGCQPCINFTWLLEATEENKKKLLNEVERRFLNEIHLERQKETV